MDLSKICEICEGVVNGNSFAIKLYDKKDSIYLSGHEDCINEIYYKVNEKCSNLPLDKTLRKLGLEV